MNAKRRPAIVVYAALTVACMALSARPARAQFQPRPLGNPAVGETFHIEAFAGFWSPSADILIAVEGLGQPPTEIDLKKDLGLTDQRFKDLRIMLRPAAKHKFRAEFTNMAWEQSATLTRDVVFNGQRYKVSIPVDSLLEWHVYRFGYEYDFIRRDRGFGGIILETKYTDVKATLSNDFVTQFAEARAPIPAIGGIVRVYPVPNVGITFELTGFNLPESVVEGYKAHYTDLDLYGTLNFNDYVGAQIGFRSLDLGYLMNDAEGSMKLKGLYFGVVARY